MSTAEDRLVATVERLRDELGRARADADARALVELAKGVLVERLRVGPTAAARELDTIAAQAGMSVTELAADIVNHSAYDEVAELPRHESVGLGDESRPVVQRLRTAESGVLAADDVQAVAEAMLEHALTPLGATAVAVWAVGADSSLSLSGAAGFAHQEIDRWRYVPPAVATAASAALDERNTLWFSGDDLAAVPSIGAEQFRDGTRAALPAMVGGRVMGVLEICWPTAIPPQPRRIVRQLDALGELCGHAMHALPIATPLPADADLARLAELADALVDPALVLVPRRDEDGVLVDFDVHHANPAAAGGIAGATLMECYPQATGLVDTIAHVHATGDPLRADRLAVEPFSDVAGVGASRVGDAVLLTWRPSDGSARWAELLRQTQRLSQVGGFEEDTLSGEITWTSELFTLCGRTQADGPIPLAELSGHAHPEDTAAVSRFVRTLLHHRRPASTTLRVRRPDGGYRHSRVVAEPVLDTDAGLVAVRGAWQEISAQYWTEVALAATRDQLASTEQESAERNRLARQLQQAIMPPTHDPLELPDLHIGVRYRPAEKDHLVGGDWYDALVLPSGQVMVSVGDIAGHGIEAATGMVVLRNALRGLAVTGAPPAQLLGWLNNVACSLSGGIHATALVGLYDPATRVLRWARAGHLPPVIATEGRASTLPLIKGLMFGVHSDATYEEGMVRLREHDMLIFYTDGLIERREVSIDESMDHLRGIVGAESDDLDRCLDRLLAEGDGDTDDDACIVGIQLR
ncbi:SpoIIE family protein phosphatase [Actinokineospora sp. HUAS TT18]|uniref:SpoIIE family protein phosphatase n=1 Tax=Actinokineospora sp. HUAS TT18 TaxID=3447451 RepID=UPI003F5285FD